MDKRTQADYDSLVLTPTERRLFDEMADGRIHTVNSLLPSLCNAILNDRTSKLFSTSNMNSLAIQISNLRTKLREIGEDVVFQKSGTLAGYRRVRLLHVSTDDT